MVVDRDAEHVGSGDDRPVDVYGVAGVRHQYGVAGIKDCQAEVGDAFLGADGDDGLAKAARGDLHLAGDVENIRREALNPTELFHEISLRHVRACRR